MIRDIVRAAWAESPVRTAASIPAAIAVVVLGWAVIVVLIVLGTPIQPPG